MSYDLLKNLEKWADFEEEAEDETETEISFVVSDLKKLLKNKECVCGASLEEHTDSYKHIEHLIEYLEEIRECPRERKFPWGVLRCCAFGRSCRLP